MDTLYVLSIILLISSFVGVFIFIVECCTDGIGADEITRGTCRVVASPSFVNVNVYDGSQAATAGRVGGGAKDVTIVIRDGINGKVNTTTTSVYSTSSTSYVENNKCGICKKAVTLESVSVNDGIRANDGGGDSNDGVDATGGASHAKISSGISS
ncbi:hypothetical protein R3W88_028627 [Solanum pinnatisectum]|uniref:Uncharacterized protein n=1 Tax=Solanum pinnatisectum TaxID=50273 RepID=A0AAV9K393_9SOLN|nr:hypothetical protein R3W88_028627 [Solanum pinnatisectum]